MSWSDQNQVLDVHGHAYRFHDHRHEVDGKPHRTITIVTGPAILMHIAEEIERAYPRFAAQQRRLQRTAAPLALVTMRVMREITAAMKMTAAATIDGHQVCATGPDNLVEGPDELVRKLHNHTSESQIEQYVATAIHWPKNTPEVFPED